MNKKKLILGSVVAWVMFNAVLMHKRGAFERIRRLNEKYNGKIPVTSDTFDYIFGINYTR